jgi:hypothetical protein
VQWGGWPSFAFLTKGWHSGIHRPSKIEDGHTLPVDLTTGAYGILDLTDKAADPNESVRVLAKVALPGDGDGEPFDAGASLSSETIKSANGKLVSDSQEIGFARSQQYTLRKILKSPN